MKKQYLSLNPKLEHIHGHEILPSCVMKDKIHYWNIIEEVTFCGAEWNSSIVTSSLDNTDCIDCLIILRNRQSNPGMYVYFENKIKNLTYKQDFENIIIEE